MTNPKADHKNRKPTATTHSSRRDAAAPLERQASASATMIEACDRLSLKLDEVAGLVGEQIEVWRQLRPPALSRPAPRENAMQRAAGTPMTERVSSWEGTPPGTPPNSRVENEESQQSQMADPPPVPSISGSPSPKAQAGQASEQRRDAAATLPPDPASEEAGARAQDEPPGAPAEDGLAAMAGDARRLVDTLARSGGGGPEQAAGVRQALEAIMAYLENQAATAAPKVDADGIMSRLRDLEERQQNLQSQFNASR